MGEMPHTPPTFWAYSHTRPQGVELSVNPLLIIMLSDNHIPQSVFGPDPPPPDFLAVQTVPIAIYEGLSGSAKCPHRHI